ncbi:hypothetical protein BACPEC_01053 [[Bacteroides] pectinophilus ATCC 43243]|uniref:Uncharacterized protein n=1 Tax=[Bacteroides] pectinophilus ATCC 43243 TaxID=483218 RepID=B7AQU6_9FIRM|nr:hypothetical protein BACPEC_01053 [[Bacteroides] pectinophilus ATCC 43243]
MAAACSEDGYVCGDCSLCAGTRLFITIYSHAHMCRVPSCSLSVVRISCGTQASQGSPPDYHIPA